MNALVIQSLLLRHLDRHWTGREISEVTGIPENAVYEALERLRDETLAELERRRDKARQAEMF